jgi:hypothetical protein
MEKSKNLAFLIIAVEALAIIALGAFLIQSGVSGSIPADKAGQLAVDYINKNFPSSDGSVATLVKSETENGVYKLTIKFGENEYTSYVTKDSNIFFTEGISLEPVEPAKIAELPKADKPELDIFVMSFCPYGNQAEVTAAPIVNLLKDKASIKLHYVFYSNYGDPAQASQYCYDKDRKYCSMHGIQELNQGVRELCVAKYQPDKFWSFVKNINDGATAQDVDSKWEAIATGIGINTQKIKDCYKTEAESILKSEVELTSKSYPVSDPSQHNKATEATIAGSPTFVINGTIYDGARTSEDVKVAICSAFNTQPAECQQTLTSTSTAAAGSCN